MENKENIVRVLLKNEFTWILLIGSFTLGFFNMVILPISQIQSQLASIQSTLVEAKTINNDFNARITKNANDLIRLKEKLGIQ